MFTMMRLVPKRSRSHSEVKGQNEYCLIWLPCRARISIMHHRIGVFKVVCCRFVIHVCGKVLIHIDDIQSLSGRGLNPFPFRTKLIGSILLWKQVVKTWKIFIKNSLIVKNKDENIVAKGEITHHEKMLIMYSESIYMWEKVKNMLKKKKMILFWLP